MSQKETESSEVSRIWHIIERLRSENGCPWDRKQTPEKVQTYLVEEAHEAAAAVRDGKTEDAADELGDVLFMVLFLVYLYKQRGDFGLEQVCNRVSEKMIRRHPHVFGDLSVDTAEEVKNNWEKIKAGEKSASGRQPDPVPESLPALMRAYRILSRLAPKENGTWTDLRQQADKLAGKSRSLADAVANGSTITGESLGELLLLLVNIARLEGHRAEDILHERLRGLANP
ncbi:MAG: MazG family protein [Desulfobacteraceae bacterium]|nr:MazG family protein [Desulfobacteraceae bacterium]